MSEEFFDAREAPDEPAGHPSEAPSSALRRACSTGLVGLGIASADEHASALELRLSLIEPSASNLKRELGALGATPVLAWLRTSIGDKNGDGPVGAGRASEDDEDGKATHDELALMQRASDEQEYARQLELRRASFDSVADIDGLLDFAGFARLVRLRDSSDCGQQLQQETLTDAVLRRVFSQLDREGSGRISHADLEFGLRRWHILSSIMSSYAPCAESRQFCVPPHYDYSQPTSVNYGAPEGDPDAAFEPENAAVRELRDYSYHARYKRARQRWQDAVMRGVVMRTDPQPRPWLVFTCGPMGAGKGYALSWMSERGHFPLESIVHIDPDHFRQLMPEWPAYAKRDPTTAGSHTHAEACYLQELATECAMRGLQHVWVDGSLRDGDWFSRVLDDVRARHPLYRIAIIHVYASESVVRRRCAERAARTARTVPEQLLQETLCSPEQTLRRVTHKVDFVARIQNDEQPKLEALLSVDRSGCWAALASQFSAVSQATHAEFPDELAPLALVRTRLLAGDLDPAGVRALHRLPAGGGGCGSDDGAANGRAGPGGHAGAEGRGGRATLSIALTEAAQQRAPELAKLSQALGLQPGQLALELSTVHPYGDDEDSRALADVPCSAYNFAYAYPSWLLARLRIDEKALSASGLAPSCAEVQLLLFGGFVFFNLEEDVVAVNAVTRAPSRHMVQFGPPVQLPPEMAASLSGRWHPVTLPALLRKEAQLSYCWICPGEKLADRRVAQYGGLAFSFANLHGIGPSRPRAVVARRLGVSEALLEDRFFPVLGKFSTRTLPPAASISRPASIPRGMASGAHPRGSSAGGEPPDPVDEIATSGGLSGAN